LTADPGTADNFDRMRLLTSAITRNHP
jgi:hypothetical protein